VLHWLASRASTAVSMTNMKFAPAGRAGHKYRRSRSDYRPSVVPADAQVEIDAKKAAGYYAPEGAPKADELKRAKGAASASDRAFSHGSPGAAHRGAVRARHSRCSRRRARPARAF